MNIMLLESHILSNVSYRSHKESMKRLRKLLSKSSKARRRRQHLLNIQITILAWLAEFLGFFIIFLGSFILGHENAVVTLSLQTLTMIILFIACPSVYLINSSKMKNYIVDSQFYVKFVSKWGCWYKTDDDPNDGERIAFEDENSG